MEDLDVLKGKRKIVKGKLTRLFTFICNSKDENLSEIKVRELRAKECFMEFESIQEKIELLIDSEEEADVAAEEAVRENFEEKYYTVAAMISNLLNPISVTNKPPESSGPGLATINFSANQLQPQNNLPMLPPIQLPKFSGSYGEFMNFTERFKKLVDSNPNLLDSDKLAYLKGCVEADAAETISSLTISDVNYRVALDLLEKRYKNTRLIVAEHVENILGSPCLVKNSHESVRKLINDISVNIEALRSLNITVGTWDALLIPIIAKKFDYQAKREWEVSLGVEVPKLADLLSFLEKRFNILHSLSKVDNYANKKLQSRAHLNTTPPKRKTTTNCPLCYSNEHNVIYKCPAFLSLDVGQRTKKCKQLNLCIKCLLLAKHSLEKCRFSQCKWCKGNHNNLLHRDDPEISAHYNIRENNAESDPSVANTAINAESSTSLCTKNNFVFSDVMLPTAIVQVRDKKGTKRDLRCLLDCGSQSSFLSESALKLLDLPTTPIKFQVNSISNGVTSINKAVKIQISSKEADFTSPLLCLVVKEITSPLPNRKVQLAIPAGITLADPNYGTPGTIHLLLGSELFWQIMRPGRLQLESGPCLQNTVFGFLVGGPTGTQAIKSCTFFVKLTKEPQLEGPADVEVLYNGEKGTKFPKVEVVKSAEFYDSFCEKQFQETVRRGTDHRFITALPFKECRPLLGKSKGLAEKRFLSLEKKLENNPELYNKYRNVMQNYLDSGHLIKVPQPNKEGEEVYYLPHRAVLKNSLTSSTRVVFDAGAKSSNGVSLNDILNVGPALQQNLFGVLAKFRLHRYAITADLTQMYMQIWLQEQDWNYQRVLWRNSRQEKLQIYCLTRVSFGLSCSPFLAMRCVKQLAFENKTKFPQASETILNDMYIDDLLTGSDTIEKAVILRDEIISVLNQAKFRLHKWCSNDPVLLEGLDNVSSNSLVKLNWQEDQKTLGLIWNAAEDCFKFEPKTLLPDRITKRNVSSILGMFFDPLGLLSAVTVTAKILLQKLWSLRLGWDEEIPDGLKKEFRIFLKELAKCSEIKIPRKVIPAPSFQKIELHTFTDSSEKAYGCCLYIRILDNDGNFHTNLICSKSKVAPLKSISIPRLELCAAVLGAEVAHQLGNNLQLKFDKQYFWCDSNVVLAWITQPYYKWPTYVANRVKRIQTLTDAVTWHYVSTNCNPADLVSRGTSANRLIKLSLWWMGPAFLQKEILPSESRKEQNPMENTECSIAALSLVERQSYSEFWNTFFRRNSSFTKIVRIMAYVLRFVNKTKNKHSKATISLTVDELETAEKNIFKITQKVEFSQELSDFKRTGSVGQSCKFLSLKPFVDTEGILRVGGRLTNAPEIDYDTKHPIIVPHNHHITKLIVTCEHQRALHAGPQATLYRLRQKFWIPKGRSTVKSILKECVICFRSQPSTNEPLMGDLPRVRLEYVKPFFSCGIDFAGPFSLRLGGPRSQKYSKAYLCLFICLTTKAVHLELTSDLTTKSFLNTLRRFIARRGQVRHIYSDNAKTFIGADKELSNFFKNQSFKEVESNLVTNKVTWHFIPPHAPNFGGIWERAVRSVKTHLKRVMGKTPLNFEEFHTILLLVENCLNSRPLTPISNDPNDLLPLTPNHFLFGDGPSNLPELDLTVTPKNRLRRYQLVLSLRQDIWRRWQLEYFNNLQQRHKWQKDKGNPKVGDLVLVKADGIPPAQWLTGRICEVFPGHDGVVRVANVKTVSGVLKRPMNKLCGLPVE